MNPSNGTVTFTGNFVGDNATYACDTGFELVGDAITQCILEVGNATAYFMPAAPLCHRELRMDIISIRNHFVYFLLALCSSPSNPDNGVVTVTGNSVGDNATFVCNAGFELVGDEVATCTQAADMSSALFLPAEPTCLRKC